MLVSDFLTNRASPSLAAAFERAIDRADLAPEPVTFALLIDEVLQDEAVQGRLPAAARDAVRAAAAQAGRDFPPAGVPAGQFAFDLGPTAAAAVSFAEDAGLKTVTPVLFLAACLAAPPFPDPACAAVQAAVRAAGLNADMLIRLRRRDADYTYRPFGFGVDLTAMARDGYWSACPLVGMEAELKRLVKLLGTMADSAVLVGEPGVGKSALAYGLAYHLAHGTRPLVPPTLDGATVVMITPVNLLAGAGVQGELESRIQKVLGFLVRHPLVVPFFDEIHTLLDSEDRTARGVGTALKEPMARGAFRCIGATTDKEYARFIAADEALNSRFTKLLIAEPDHATTVRIIEGSLPSLIPEAARDAGVTLSGDGVRAAVRIAARFRRTDRLPRTAVRLVRAAVADKLYERLTANPPPPAEVTAADVARTFSDQSGIPVDDLDPERAAHPERLRTALSARVRGQPEAVAAVADWLALQANGWLDPTRPRGRFLFLGPPGVGKTELALALAEQVMRDRGSLIVKNMGEFKGEGAKSRFLGADPGYIGFGQTSTVYSKVLMRPYSVVVLDEIEKADPSLADALLSLLDGFAEDSQGRGVDFSQCVIVFTSNALGDLVGGGASEGELRQRLVASNRLWSQPLVDRIDKVVPFRRLTRDGLAEILADLVARRKAVAARPLPAAIDEPAARDRILQLAAESGGAESARGLERALLRWLSDPAARTAVRPADRL